MYTISSTYSEKKYTSKKCVKNDHLGNVRVVISDEKEHNNGAGQVDGQTAFVEIDNGDYFTPTVISFTDFYPFGQEMRKAVSAFGPYRYGAANGQEKVDEIAGAGNHYTAEFWEYDPRTARRWNLDPVPQISISDYAVFRNNPISVIDPFGDDPTDKETAAMADDVYKTKDGKYTENNGPSEGLGKWQLSKSKFEGVTLTDDVSGFNSAVYERQNGTDKEGKPIMEYCYVTQGTNPTSKEDWETNLRQSLGLKTTQYDLSVKNAKKLDEQVIKKGAGLSFAGHSLGGGLASANALATGRNATTFNAAGLSMNTRTSLGLNQKANIRAYVVEGEIVSNSQKLLGLKAEGKIFNLPAFYLPEAPSSIPAISNAARLYNTYQRINNHTMGVVIEKMAADPKIK